MTKTETFEKYEDFHKRRLELENSLKYFVDSYCDRRLGVFKLTFHSVWKEVKDEQEAKG